MLFRSTLNGIQVDCSMVCNPTDGIMDGFLGVGDPFGQNPCDASNSDGSTAGGGGGDEPPDPPACPGYIRNFFNVAIPIANQLASTWSTDPHYILALSAYESGWLGTHAQSIHNLFGLTNKGGNDLHLSSYQASADFWSKNDGKYIEGDASIAAFSQDIQPHYNTANPDWTQTLVSVFTSVLSWRVICGQ